MTQAPATPELVERLRDQRHVMQGNGFAALLATTSEATAALEAQQARIAELEGVLKGTLLDWQTLAQRQAYFAAPLNVAKIEAALSSQGRHEGGEG